MPEIIQYRQDLLRRGAGYFVNKLEEGDYVIVANAKRPLDSFVLIKATDLADLLAERGYGIKAKEIRDALFTIDSRSRVAYSEGQKIRWSKTKRKKKKE